jgi:hypothetical protein
VELDLQNKKDAYWAVVENENGDQYMPFDGLIPFFCRCFGVR